MCTCFVLYTPNSVVFNTREMRLHPTLALSSAPCPRRKMLATSEQSACIAIHMFLGDSLMKIIVCSGMPRHLRLNGVVYSCAHVR
jgi:hypothetical protein